MKACSTYVFAFASISSGERIGRSAERPGGVADPRRVVADDEDADVAGILKGAHPLQWDAAADVEVGRGDVDAELDPERPPELQLGLEPAGGKDVDGVAGEGLDHGPTILGAKRLFRDLGVGAGAGFARAPAQQI